MRAFVIEYNRRTGESRVTEFKEPTDATRERFRLMELRQDQDVEIATIMGRSLDSVRQTHSRYFKKQALAAA